MSEVIASVGEASAWLEGLINFERGASYANVRLDLEPIRKLLARLGNPQASLSIIHVAGSKGKGSTCLFAESILTALGERVGTFTSPHLESWTERFRIGGSPVQGQLLADAVEAVRPHVEALQDENPESAPTFFDATTAAALLLFARSRVSRVLLEVGLGGRLDSTNAVQPAVTCITQIELEHTEKLGDTLAAIASEKAGIIKPGVPCIMGPLEEEAGAVVVSRAEALAAPLFRWGNEVRVDRLETSEWSSQGIMADARQAFVYRERSGFEVSAGLGVLGAHQVDNAAMAIAAVRLLGGWKEADLIEAIRLGLSQASLPGRLELFGERPWLLVDSAHTERSAGSLRRALEAMPARRRLVVVSISRGKDSEKILSELLVGAEVAWMTRAEPIRSIEPGDLAVLARRLAPQCRIECVEDPRTAVESARAMLSRDDLLCCAGSIYLAGIARRVFADAGAQTGSRAGEAPAS